MGGEKLFKRLFYLIILAVLVLVGCSDDGEEGSSSSSSEDGGKPTTLQVAFNAQPPTLDPYVTSADPTRDITILIYEPLVSFDENLTPQPMLAESYEVSEDGTKITFKLREGVLFHNGDEMKAEDVVASMTRWQQYSSRAKSAFPDAEYYAEDDYTVVMDLKVKNRSALDILASPTQIPGIMPKEVIDAIEDEEAGVQEYIGTGPFEFDEWKQDQYIKLKKFEDYVAREEPANGLVGKKEVFVDEVYLNFVPDSSTRVTGVISGEYDIANAVDYNSYNQIVESDRVEPYSNPAGFNVLVFNKKEGPFADKKLRQAVAYALDMENILNASFNNEEVYALNHSLFLETQTLWYTDAGKDIYNSQNIEKAKQLIEESSYNGEPIRFLTSREYEDFYNASVVIQEQLKQIGLNVELETSDWATVGDKRKNPSAYEAFITAWTIQSEPTQILFLDSKTEWDGWTESEEIDKYLQEIREADSDEEAMKANKELQKAIWDYIPALKFGDKNYLYAVSKDIEGFRDLNGTGGILWGVKKTGN